MPNAVEAKKLNDRQSNFSNTLSTVWHEIFAGVYFCGLAIFCVLRELISAIRSDWFFLQGINFCDFQKVPSSIFDNIFVFIEYVQ